MPQKTSLIILLFVSFSAIILTFMMAPIPQDLTYHDFADKRSLLFIPNFGDVMGNIFFIIFGIWALFITQSLTDNFSMKGEKRLWQVFFISTIMVGFGSGYYHLTPNNHTLIWDRLPMTIAFMSFFSLTIMERISPKIGLLLFPIFLLIGIGSVFYWDYTETLGQGDLRPYALVQFLPMLLIPLIYYLFPARYDNLKYLFYTLFWYILAKILEYFDTAIFNLTQHIISGHTLKHIAAAMAILMMVKYIQKRRIIPPA